MRLALDTSLWGHTVAHPMFTRPTTGSGTSQEACACVCCGREYLNEHVDPITIIEPEPVLNARPPSCLPGLDLSRVVVDPQPRRLQQACTDAAGTHNNRAWH